MPFVRWYTGILSLTIKFRKPLLPITHKRSLTKAKYLCQFLAVLVLEASFSVCVASTSSVSTDNRNETKTRLTQLEKRKREFHERVKQVRKKEQLALLRLHNIQTKLNATRGVLTHHKKELRTTEHKIGETEEKLEKNKSTEETLSDQAKDRLKEIYEGQRLSFLEMLFSVDSLQLLLDRYYFQERIVEQDKRLLQDLRTKAALLSQKKEQLGDKANKLGSLVSEFAKKAMAIAKEKFDQEQVAQRLRTQRTFYEQAEKQLALESQRLETQILEMENSNRQTTKNMATGSGRMAMPLAAQVTSPFGWRRHPIFGVRKFHTGIDLAGPNHSTIRAADSGNVLYTGWYGGYGKVAIISHGNCMATLYAHMSRIAVAAGQNIRKGDVLGYEGSTGFSTGPHLHFEVRVNGKPNNPLNFLH